MNEDKLRLYKKKTLFCCNCGKYGHKYGKCNEPITSLGIIAIKPCDNVIYNKFKMFFENDKYYNLIKSNTMNNNILLEIKNYEKYFKFLMIQRRKTLGYIEFIRGRYDCDKLNEVINLFQQMTPSEIKDIQSNEFDFLWNELWKNNTDNKYYKSEIDESRKKFILIKKNKEFNKLLGSIKLDYKTPEWGFPKGRRIYLEKNVNCAVREFEEETSLTSNDYILINNIPPISETFYGTNDILYRHIYYFALCKDTLEVKLNNNNMNQMEEVGNIGFFNFIESSNLIRDYHLERKNILNEAYLFMSSVVKNNFKLNNSIIFNNIDIFNTEIEDESISSDLSSDEIFEQFTLEP